IGMPALVYIHSTGYLRPGPMRRFTLLDLRLTKRGSGRPLGPTWVVCAEATEDSGSAARKTAKAAIVAFTTVRSIVRGAIFSSTLSYSCAGPRACRAGPLFLCHRQVGLIHRIGDRRLPAPIPSVANLG